MTTPSYPGDDPARIALMDQALAEADADCLRLVAHLRTRTGDRARATAAFVQGLLDDPSWDRLELASTLGAAIAMLATFADSSEAAARPHEEEGPHV